MSEPWAELRPYRGLMRQLDGTAVTRLIEDLGDGDPTEEFSVDFELVNFSPFEIDVPETGRPEADSEGHLRDPERRSLHGRKAKKRNQAMPVEPQLQQAMRLAFPSNPKPISSKAHASAPHERKQAGVKLRESEHPTPGHTNHNKSMFQTKTDTLSPAKTNPDSQPGSTVTTSYQTGTGHQHPLGASQGKDGSLAQLTDQLMSLKRNPSDSSTPVTQGRKDVGSARPREVENGASPRGSVASAGREQHLKHPITPSSSPTASSRLAVPKGQAPITPPSKGSRAPNRGSQSPRWGRKTQTASFSPAEGHTKPEDGSGLTSPVRQAPHLDPAPSQQQITPTEAPIQGDALGSSPLEPHQASLNDNPRSGRPNYHSDRGISTHDLLEDDLVERVNEALVEQARIHGVDLW